IPPSESDVLLTLEHPDPHSILGAHPGHEGVTVRAFRPGARNVSVVADGNGAWPMAKVAAAGLFEVTIREQHLVFPYQLRTQYPDGKVVTTHDQYAYLPTIS